MKFVKLNTTLITAALHDHETTGTPVPFNSSFHPASDAPDLRRPIDTPYSFKRWLPLILSTRHTHHEHDSDEQIQCPALQTVRLTLAQTRLLHAATDASLLTRQLNRLYRDDIADEIAPLLQKSLVFPARGLFLRLDACSPKDGAGALALRSVDDVVRKVVTSVRARNALFHFLQGHDQAQSSRVGDKEGQGQGEGMELFFLPFDERMAGDREYRVFCRPGDGRVTGVSQYRWYRT
ncbi:hypothetical protein NEMBOFW57_005757 [Staphylotrichum longicolle]|uniref:Uncharacterized protein n=1 Tax=Staphylotrichum longicolle TaxID=669026 RepID=A0AAD4F0V1_9PEZI|nr:hypothetical protein NEMBOFW57_005757 [Staphylotrichum longicolle]